MAFDDGLPYDIIAQPAAGTDTVNILPQYQDPLSTEQVKRMRVPTGVSVIMISNDTAFTITLLMLRDGYEREVAVVEAGAIASAQLITERTDSEMWIMLSSASNIAHRRTNRIGLKIIPTGTFEG